MNSRQTIGFVVALAVPVMACSRAPVIAPAPVAGVGIAAHEVPGEVSMPVAERNARTLDSRPPIDRAAPARLETATFAVG